MIQEGVHSRFLAAVCLSMYRFLVSRGRSLAFSYQEAIDQGVLACASCCSRPSCTSRDPCCSCAPTFSVDPDFCFILAFSSSCGCYAFCACYQIRFPLSLSRPIHVALRAELKQCFTHATLIRLLHVEDNFGHQLFSSQPSFFGNPDRIGTVISSKCIPNRGGDWT